MIKYFLLLLFLGIGACSITHELKITKQPCLYPYKEYDFTLCKNYTFYVDEEFFMVHRGFATDLASIPRVLWSIYSPTKTETIAGAVIHDYLYFCPGVLSRKEIDTIFYDALVYEGLPKRTAFRYWLAVRLFGKTHFNEGALCTHDHARTENTSGHLRMAFDTTPQNSQRSSG